MGNNIELAVCRSGRNWQNMFFDIIIGDKSDVSFVSNERKLNLLVFYRIAYLLM